MQEADKRAKRGSSKPKREPASDRRAGDEETVRRTLTPPASKRSRATERATRLQRGTNSNPYLDYYVKSMASLPSDIERLFDPSLDEDRREELDEAVCAVVTEDVIARYAWAIPDERALRVIGHFSPVLEIAAGGGYWSSCLRARGVDVVCADKLTGGGDNLWTKVLRAGPKLCKKHTDRALLLVYPDDFETSAKSVALRCLENYAGMTVIHAGELFGGGRLMEHPWGRSTADEFQVRLAERFHKVLEVPLPSWPYSRDALSVWRRKHVCITDDGIFGHVPAAEELRPVIACASLRHLLAERQAVGVDES
jgi:hypothetical protein